MRNYERKWLITSTINVAFGAHFESDFVGSGRLAVSLLRKKSSSNVVLKHQRPTLPKSLANVLWRREENWLFTNSRRTFRLLKVTLNSSKSLWQRLYIRDSWKGERKRNFDSVGSPMRWMADTNESRFTIDIGQNLLKSARLTLFIDRFSVVFYNADGRLQCVWYSWLNTDISLLTAGNLPADQGSCQARYLILSTSKIERPENS